MSPSVLGHPVVRREDPPLLTGAARYVADLPCEGCLVAAFVRSPEAHARIVGIDIAEAASQDGVAGVFTAGDLDLPSLPEAVIPPAQPRPALARPPLARDRVRFAGEAVAVVVGGSASAAADAVEMVMVDLEPLPAVVGIAGALAPDAPVLFPDHGTNVVIDWPPASDGALADAEVTVEGRFVNQRLAPVPMEANAVLAVPVGEGLEVFASTQVPFRLRDALCRALGLAEDRVRVVAPAVGGGFGAKGGAYPEYLVVAALARRLGRPVRWVETRSENMVAMTHGRGQVQHVQVGARRDGTLVGLRASIVTDGGAYPWRVGIPTRTTRLMASGVYRIPVIETHTRSVVTNTSPTGPYRGAGRPEATAMVERAMDLLAHELGMDPAELRRRNFVRPEDFPYRTATGAVYDSGDYGRALEEALHLVGYEDLRAEQEARRRSGRGRPLGIGMSTFVEVSGGAWEFGSVKIEADGTATVLTGSSPHGQGHETTFSQVAADALGMPVERVTVRHSDTAVVPRGIGTFGSRSGQLGGSAVLRAAEEVMERARELGAHLLEAAPEDLVAADGGLAVAGVPARAVTWAELAAAAADPARRPSGFGDSLSAENDVAAVDGGTFPFGAHVAVVEVDTETGQVSLERMVAVDDCGQVINPMIVAGQVHGGLAQGVAQALFEEVGYDDHGNPLTTNLADYSMPSAADLPGWELGETETPTDRNPLGVKGVGESGTVGAAAAVQNAVLDALRPFGVLHLDMPLTPRRVWEALKAR